MYKTPPGQVPNGQVPQSQAIDETRYKNTVVIPKSLSMSDIQLLTPPNMQSGPKPRIRLEPPILVPVPRTLGEIPDFDFGASSRVPHPPEPTTPAQIYQPAVPTSSMPTSAISRFQPIPNDPGKNKKRVRRVTTPRKPRQANSKSAGNTRQPTPANRVQTPVTGANHRLNALDLSDSSFYPQDPTPYDPSHQAATFNMKTYFQL